MNSRYRSLLLGTVVLLALGCTSAKDRLIGTWVTPSSEEKAEAPPEPKREGLAGLVAGLVEGAKASVKTEVIFRSDGTGRRADSAMGFSNVVDGFWKVAVEEGDTATVYVSQTKEFSSYEAWDITFLDNGRLRIVFPDRTAELERQPKG